MKQTIISNKSMCIYIGNVWGRVLDRKYECIGYCAQACVSICPCS